MCRDMIRKGYKFKRNKHLSYRYADGVNDKRVDGKVIPENYVVIVRVKDCPIVETEVKNGKKVKFFSTEGVKHLPVQYHSRTDFVFGPLKSHEFFKNEKYNPIYWVEDGEVYQGRAYQKRELKFEDAVYILHEEVSEDTLENTESLESMSAELEEKINLIASTAFLGGPDFVGHDYELLDAAAMWVAESDTEKKSAEVEELVKKYWM